MPCRSRKLLSLSICNLRIIAGAARGRRLYSPGQGKNSSKIRPTTDRAREALFNILGSDCVNGARVLDLFAGTGALGVEALSRGAGEVVFVEKDPFALGLIQKNVTLCGFSDRTHVIRHDLLKGRFFLLGRADLIGCYDLIFIDPPYRQKSCHRLVLDIHDYDIIGADSIVVCEDASSESMPDTLGELELFDQRRYGDTGFWFYRP